MGSREDPGRPLFSIIVPTHGRPEQLEECLSALAKLEYPRDRFEVVVVNDGGAPLSPQVAARFDGQLLVVCSENQVGPAGARNAGAARARGALLAFTDDDCRPREDWLTRLEARLAAEPAIAVGGHTVNLLESVWCSMASQLLIDYLYEYYQHKSSGGRFFTSNNLAVPADFFWNVGGFDGRFPLAAAEDREFCERWQRHGFGLVYAGDALVYHSHALNLLRFIRQHFIYGRGADFLHRSRGGFGAAAWRPKLEPPSFYRKLVFYPFSRRLGWRALPLSALLFISQVAYGVGYFWERGLRAWRARRARTDRK